MTGGAGGLPEPTPNVPPAAVLFGFDDGADDVYENALPILQAAGYPATAYVISDLVGTAGYMTEAQLIALDAAGWDVANHTTGHTALDTQTLEQQTAAMTGCAEYLEGIGLTRGARHLAYPYGARNGDTTAAMAAAGILTSREWGMPSGTIPCSMYDLTGVINLGAEYTLDAAKQYVLNPTPSRLVIFTGHHIDDSGDPYAWPPEDFAALVAYVKACGCRVVTISQLWDYMQAGYVWPE